MNVPQLFCERARFAWIGRCGVDSRLRLYEVSGRVLRSTCFSHGPWALSKHFIYYLEMKIQLPYWSLLDLDLCSCTASASYHESDISLLSIPSHQIILSFFLHKIESIYKFEKISKNTGTEYYITLHRIVKHVQARENGRKTLIRIRNIIGDQKSEAEGFDR